MILIIGGSSQGKTAYAEQMKAESPDYEIWDDFHVLVREMLAMGNDEGEVMTMLYERMQGDNLIIVSDEIGNGIVPLEKEDRAYRDFMGQLLCDIAEEAEHVIRMVCGIPSVLK